MISGQAYICAVRMGLVAFASSCTHVASFRCELMVMHLCSNRRNRNCLSQCWYTVPTDFRARQNLSIIGNYFQSLLSLERSLSSKKMHVSLQRMSHGYRYNLDKNSSYMQFYPFFRACLQGRGVTLWCQVYLSKRRIILLLVHCPSCQRSSTFAIKSPA